VPPDLDPEAVIALQQRGIIRRHPCGDHLELTDDAAFSLHPDNKTGRHGTGANGLRRRGTDIYAAPTDIYPAPPTDIYVALDN
jgi:hypothetical protein